jgi:transcriptional regulator with XRE-family HTH domain
VNSQALTVGSLIREYRISKKWSMSDLAGKVKRSASWVAQVERNEIIVTDIIMLEKLAVVLGVSRSDLIEAALGPEAVISLRDKIYVEELRKAISGHPILDIVGQSIESLDFKIDLQDMQTRRDSAWELVHASSYKELGPFLAKLISDLEKAIRFADDDLQIKLLELLADVYQVAAATLVKVGDRGAAWVAADRSIAAGEKCNDRNLVIAGQLRMARTMLNSSERGLALHVIEQITKLVTDAINSKDQGLISLVGASLLLLAIVDARENNELAREYIAIARQLALVLKTDFNEYGTEFGLTNVAMHAVSVEVELGNGGEALKLAKNVPNKKLSKERQARYWIDVARANILVASFRKAIVALLHAEDIAAEELIENSFTKDIISQIENKLKSTDPNRKVLIGLKRRLYS